MNRDDIHERLHFGDKLDYRSFNELHEAIEEIFDYFEEEEPILNNYTFTSCDDCKNKLDGIFQEVCSNCKRFYGCYFESKEM